jgi:hypothetical protein
MRLLGSVFHIPRAIYILSDALLVSRTILLKATGAYATDILRSDELATQGRPRELSTALVMRSAAEKALFLSPFLSHVLAESPLMTTFSDGCISGLIKTRFARRFACGERSVAFWLMLRSSALEFLCFP